MMPRAHRWCDGLTEGLLYAMIVFAPWVFGATQAWAVWTMNGLAYALGLAWLAKLRIRRREAYAPPRWTGDAPGTPRLKLLAAANAALLAYVLAAALNARSDYDPAARTFTDFEPLRWLPHSYDRTATWLVFWQWLGFSAVFWAVRDWLLTKTGADRRSGAAGHDGGPAFSEAEELRLPRRLRRLLWVLVLNAALVAAVGIFQKLDGTNKLLWLVEPRYNKAASEQFGPYAYRSNAAQYLNLIWPAALALWVFTLVARGARDGERTRWDGPHLLLLPAAMLMAAAPVISLSRGGALVTALLLVTCLGALFLARRTTTALMRGLALGTFLLAGLLGVWLGWDRLHERFLQVSPKRELTVNAWTNDFTLLARLDLPAAPPRRWTTLFSVGGSADTHSREYSFSLSLATNGALHGRLVGGAVTNTISLVATNFIQGFGGRSLLLAAVRTTNLQFHVEGTPVGAVTQRRNDAPDWRSPLISRFVWAFDPAARELALLNYALDPEALRALAAAGSLTNITAAVRPPVTLADALSDVEIRAIADAGILGKVVNRPGGARRWIGLERLVGLGPLFVTRALTAEDGRFDGPALLRMRVWNPAPEERHLAAGFDGVLGEPALIGAGEERELELRLRQPLLPVASTFTIAVTDEDGEVDRLIGDDGGIYFTGMTLQPQADVSVARLARGGAEVELGDRLSGRETVYRNAARMAADHPLWGLGPGAFAHLYDRYRGNVGEEWAAYAHNDWLEFRVTLGWAGLLLLGTVGALVVIQIMRGPGVTAPALVMVLLAAGLAGCLLHAAVDFPFQVHSVAFTFVLLTAVLSCLRAERR